MGRSRYKIHEPTATYQIWQEGIQPKLRRTDAMIISTLKNIHEGPAKRGYVDEAMHWRYSSASDHEGIRESNDVERFW